MSRKLIKEGSYQAKVLELLKENPSEEYTSDEIAKKFDHSQGSTSGTLAILYKGGWIKKNDGYPVKYSYLSEENSLEELTRLNEHIYINSVEARNNSNQQNEQQAISSNNSERTSSTRNHSPGSLEGTIRKLEQELKNLDDKIKSSQLERANILGKLEMARQFLNQKYG